MKNKLVCILIIIFSILILSSQADENNIKVISNELMINTNQRTSTFTGSVYAKDNNLKVWADIMTVSLEKDNDEIKNIVAAGNVKILRLNEGSEIYGNNAKYLLKEEIVIVTGDVLVIENGNEIIGNELTLDLVNSSSIMVGSSSKRVEATIMKD